MSSPGPRTILLLLLALAAIVLASGLSFARREESVHLGRDGEALHHFYGEVQGELQRLEALYESHLTRLARLEKPNDAFEVRRAADRLIGIRQFSLLHLEAKDGTDLHVLVPPLTRERTPVPVFDLSRNRGPGAALLLPSDRFFKHPDESNGWIEEPGKPLMFWQRISSKEAVVLMIDQPTVEAAIDRWLENWGAERFDPVRAGKGPDQLRTHRGQALLAEGGVQTDRPDLLLPLRTRLGSWELASWDRRESRVHYDTTTLATSGVLSLFVAMLGVLVYGQQQRAATVAAQRVSFVNRVSHELRSPLTNILLNIDLATEAVEDSPGEATRRLALVQEEARRLGRLIDNVLIFSRHEQGKLRVESRACVPANVVAAVVEQFAPSFQRHALEVRCTGDLAAACLLDADALAQILANLLSNVEKYVPGGVIEISGSLLDGMLTMHVADHGPGIPAEAAERVFRPFERLDSRIDEGVSGTGLGLAIARDLAAEMGGTLVLRPRERGACFELRVPAPSAPPLTAISAA